MENICLRIRSACFDSPRASRNLGLSGKLSNQKPAMHEGKDKIMINSLQELKMNSEVWNSQGGKFIENDQPRLKLIENVLDESVEHSIIGSRMEKPVDFEEALQVTGYGKFNIALLLICGACMFTVNTDAYSMGYLLPAAQCDLNLNTVDKGILTSMSFAGIICSSHMWGFLSDTRGRKNIIIITLLLSFSCTLLSSFVVNFWMFAVMRFFSGVFIAGPSATVYAYLGEFHGAKYRTITITCASLFIAIAIIALPGLAWLIIPQKWSVNIFDLFEYKPWRFFLVLCSLPCLLVAMALLPFPESPKFLLLRGKRPQALAVLKKVYAYNTGKKENDFPVQDLMDTYTEPYVCKKSRFTLLISMWNQTAPLFRKPHLLNTFVTCNLQFGLFAASSGLLLWYPEIVNQLAEHSRKHPGSSITVCEAISTARNVNTTHLIPCSDAIDISVFQQNLIIGFAYAIGFIVIALVVNMLGKRTLLVFCLVVSGASGIALCWTKCRLVIDFLFIGLLVLSGVCVSIVNAAVVELFPTYLRAMAMCISLMSGRLGSVVASSTIGILLELNCIATFVIFSAILFVCAGLSLFIPNHEATTKKCIT